MAADHRRKLDSPVVGKNKQPTTTNLREWGGREGVKDDNSFTSMADGHRRKIDLMVAGKKQVTNNHNAQREWGGREGVKAAKRSTMMLKV